MHGHKNIKELKKFINFLTFSVILLLKMRATYFNSINVKRDTSYNHIKYNVKRCNKNGVDGFIIKPFSTNEIKKITFLKIKKIALPEKKLDKKFSKFTFADYANDIFIQKIISKLIL